MHLPGNKIHEEVFDVTEKALFQIAQKEFKERNEEIRRKGNEDEKDGIKHFLTRFYFKPIIFKICIS